MLVSYWKCLLLILGSNLNLCNTSLHVARNTDTAARVCVNTGLPDRSQYATGRSCDRPTRTRFSVVFLGRRAIGEQLPKIPAELQASYAALPMGSKFRHNAALQTQI